METDWKSRQTPAKQRTEEQRTDPKTPMGRLGLALREALGIDPTKPMVVEWDGVEIKEG